MRLRLGASGAEKLCTLGAIGRRFCAALNFTVRPPGMRARLTSFVICAAVLQTTACSPRYRGDGTFTDFGTEDREDSVANEIRNRAKNRKAPFVRRHRVRARAVSVLVCDPGACGRDFVAAVPWV